MNGLVISLYYINCTKEFYTWKKAMNLLIFSLYNLSNFKLIKITINQENKYGLNLKLIFF